MDKKIHHISRCYCSYLDTSQLHKNLLLLLTNKKNYKIYWENSQLFKIIDLTWITLIMGHAVYGTYKYCYYSDLRMRKKSKIMTRFCGLVAPLEF